MNTRQDMTKLPTHSANLLILLAPYSTITEGCYLKYNPECPDGTFVSLSSEFVGQTPHQVSKVLGRPVYFYRLADNKDQSDCVFLSRQAIDKVFAEATTAADAIVGLYRQVHPDFDEILSFEGHPSCSKEMWNHICQKFMDAHCRWYLGVPEMNQPMKGGTWLNSGFSTIDGPTEMWLVRPTPEKELLRDVKI